MDQWKSLFGAYRLARSRRDGCAAAGNGAAPPPHRQTRMMNSDAFTCQQLLPLWDLRKPERDRNVRAWSEHFSP